jgi:hypothetical protein
MRLLTEARWTLANLADDGLFPASWSVRYYIVVVTGHQTGLVLTRTQPVDTLLWALAPCYLELSRFNTSQIKTHYFISNKIYYRKLICPLHLLLVRGHVQPTRFRAWLLDLSRKTIWTVYYLVVLALISVVRATATIGLLLCNSFHDSTMGMFG